MVSFVTGAPSSGAGKTIATVGLIAALRARGHSIHPAKVGPDYIDPAYLTAAAGRPAVNLDLWAMRPGLFTALASRENLVVEGVMGLFDGPASGKGSTAHVAKALKLPVILIVNAERQSHSVAALVHGFSTFDRTLRFAGVLLTRVASARHEAMLKNALATIPIPVLGAIPRDPTLVLQSRHLGLYQAGEQDLGALIADAARVVATHVDLAAVERIAPPQTARDTPPPALPPPGQRVAIARDAAFSFAYPHLAEGWHHQGATLCPFSPLAGEAPDQTADAIVLPGGYPELYAGPLAATRAWAEGLSAAQERGAFIYGECGGYMALGETLIDGDGVAHTMAGLLPLVTSFAVPRRTLGYRQLSHTGGLFPPHLRGHEFHYACEMSRPDGATPLFHAADTAGAPLGPLGIQVGRTAGSFAHLIDRADDDADPL